MRSVVTYLLGKFSVRWVLFVLGPARRSAVFSVVFVVLVCSLFLCAAGYAQTASTGAIGGVVSDAQGKIVINATVTLSSIEQGTVTIAKVNGRGEYTFANLKPGTYSVMVGAPTFASYTESSIHLNATENVRIDAKLTHGSSSENVTVEAGSATIDTRSATLATVIDPTLVQNLPVDGNNVVSLAALLPGVTNINAPTTFTNDTGGPTYVASGSRANQNLFLFDGTMWNNVYYNTGLNFPPPLMLDEISVQLVNFKAQYGRNVGSVFNALTKSGSNTVHGQLWEYIQNQALNAKDYITHLNPKLVQNQFGASVGGPILRDKLFFYLGFQDLRSVAAVVSNTELPTAAERGLNPDGVTPRPCITAFWAGQNCASYAGDYAAGANLLTGGLSNPFYAGNAYATQAGTEILSTAATAAGQTAPYNAKQCYTDLQSLANTGTPSTEAYLPNAEIPYECFNPVVANIYKKYLAIPAVNGVPVSVPTSQATTANQPRNDWNGLSRVDLVLPRSTVDARFYVTNVNDVTANSVSPNGTADANYDLDANSGGIYDGNIGDRFVINGNMVNEVRVGYKRYNYTVVPIDKTTLVDLGSNFTDPGFPTLPILSANARFTIGSNSSAYSYSVNANEEIDDNFSYVHGNHSFKVGAQFLDLQYIHRYDQPVSLTAGGSDYTALGIADFTMGLIGTLTVGNRTNISALDHAYYFYAQDDWRATARLTLNLGMRYELARPWTQPDGQSVTWIPGYQSYKFVNVPASLAYQGDPGVPTSIIKTNYSNLAPRFGLAYDIFGNGRTVFRAGFGIFYDALNANTTGVGQPYHYTAQYTTPVGSFSQPMLNQVPVPPNYTGPSNAIFAGPISVNFADPNVTEPYTMAVNIGFQQRIKSATLEVTYVGKFGRHEVVPVDLNPDIYSCNPANSYYQANPTVYCPVQPTAYGSSVPFTSTSDFARVTYPGFNYGGAGIVDNNTIGTSNYNGGQLIYTQRASKRLNAVVSYTYSRSLDDQSSGTTNASTLPRTYQSSNVNINYGPSDFQSTHILNMGWTLKLPNLPKGPRFARAILDDWNFGGLYSAHTGQPFSVTTQADYELTREPGQRAPLATGLTGYLPYAGFRHRTDKVLHWFNYCSFANGNGGSASNPNLCGAAAENIPFGYTNAVSRNSLYGPAFINTTFSVRRSVDLKYRGARAELRADAFNVFNTPNLANPIASVNGSGTSTALDNGRIVATVGTNGTVGTNARRVQIAFLIFY